MNTAGNSNRGIGEPVSIPQRLGIGMLRLLLPPHADNEQAADFLQNEFGPENPAMEWSVVRPDSLTNEDRVSEYAAFPSPTRSAIFNPGKTSRINVASFMADLITDDEVWNKWRSQMPVLYNQPTG